MMTCWVSSSISQKKTAKMSRNNLKTYFNTHNNTSPDFYYVKPSINMTCVLRIQILSVVVYLLVNVLKIKNFYYMCWDR